MFTERKKKIPIIYYVIAVKGEKLVISHPCIFSGQPWSSTITFNYILLVLK